MPTFAEMNPSIATSVAFIAQAATVVGVEIHREDTEGLAVLEGLMEIRTAVNSAIESYHEEADDATE